VIRLLGRLFPGAVVLAAALATQRFAGAAVVDEIVRGYPWVVYGLSFTLAVVFHRSRVALGALVLAAVDFVVVPEADPLWVALAGSASALVLGGLAVLRDRGVASRGGALQAVALVAVGLLAVFAWREAPERVEQVFSWAPLGDELPAVGSVRQTTVAAFALAGLAAVWGLAHWRGAVEWALAWSLVALGLALAMGGAAQASLYLMAGALILATSVVQISYAMAYRDDLTGLPSRRALSRDLDVLSGRYTLAMVDVDHFKAFNDRHGHDVGDQVLKMVAGRLGRAPGGCKAYRYGGEEFTLLFTGRKRDDVLPHLEQVREAVQGATFALRGWRRPRRKPSKPLRKKGAARKTLSVTVSIGVADSTAKDATTRSVLKKADQALYRAKNAGRNRISR
jgi:diguanylate cyclase (GGDEF)-like protein